MIRDAFGVPLFNQLDERYSGEGNEISDDLDDATKKFFNLVKEAEKELYPVELDPKPIPLTGAEVYEQVKDIKNEFGKGKAQENSYASARDMNPIAGDVNYYGVLTDIIVLHYSKKYRFVLFKCDWVDNGTGLVDRDGLSFTLVNFNHLAHSHSISDEQFIFASQAEQYFFFFLTDFEA
ncbi:hypothetical protein RJ639_029877 [Escallonia herrerae]|uniref:DUF4216 domain-containing protein n=1 Tax=Escallonia herrerae TaxID=1293975 RepID=A0AA88X303_9ASTE|nr:hypothetical protein RJ639_029877 [Escallonia herrerae]